MADKAISDLTAAEKITDADLFLLEQGGTAKKLTGQTLIAFLTALADGHGGVSGIAKTGTEGLVDTYRITLADGNVFDFTVTNGEKGDKGDNAYTWIKYASQEPTEDSHSMGDLPDSWMGVYAGNLAAAPDDWTLYNWFEIKGEKGDTGDPAVLESGAVAYQIGSSASEIPSGEWLSAIPETPQGSYLWTRVVQTFNSGDPVTFYSVSRIGVDGLGTLRTINNIEADENGNVNLTAANVGALAKTGDYLQGALNANGHSITGLATPTDDTDAVPYGFVKDLQTPVWTNAAVTSEFVSQSLTLADTKNKNQSTVAIIYLQVSTEDTTMIVSGELPMITGGAVAFRMFCPVAGSSAFAYRDVRIVKYSTYARVVFDNAYLGATEANGYMIPVEIDFARQVT